MNAVIIANGTIDDYSKAKEYLMSSDLIICADGGTNHVINMGLVPHAIIGDADSIDKECLNGLKAKGVETITYPTDKDETDTQLAVEYAVNRGAREITMLGCIGTRFDHSFGNVAILIWLMKRGIRGKIVNFYNEIHVIDRYIILEGKPGEKLSLLPITPNITGIFTKGLKYELQDGELFYDKPRGMSNEFISDSAEVVIRDGMLMVIKAKD